MIPAPLIEEIPSAPALELLAERLQGQPGVMLLQSALPGSPQSRYSFLVARPFLTLQSWGSRCLIEGGPLPTTLFGNPWHILHSLLSRFELLEELDWPFPLGGCFGYWGYDLKHFVEPKLTRQTYLDLDLPDCHLGFYGSLLALDHQLGKAWIIATGLKPDGTRSRRQAVQEHDFWRQCLDHASATASPPTDPFQRPAHLPAAPRSNLSREEFHRLVHRAQDYIRAGHIYQVNLSRRLTTPMSGTPWDLYRRLTLLSPAPFAAWLDAGRFQLASSSPELFLQLSGNQIRTRPIKGTRPRSMDPIRDAQLSYELQTSPKEMAELIMITDLLRNDLGRVCDFGSVQVPELVRLERYPHVQHLVSTVEGRLRPALTHSQALAACFPGGSITGAPKFRAMDIIEELEPVARGPYTGCVGYLGFNRESQLSILIRTAICHNHLAHFQVGAGIVADSDPEFEYEETQAKAGGFLESLRYPPAKVPRVPRPPSR